MRQSGEIQNMQPMEIQKIRIRQALNLNFWIMCFIDQTHAHQKQLISRFLQLDCLITHPSGQKYEQSSTPSNIHKCTNIVKCSSTVVFSHNRLRKTKCIVLANVGCYYSAWLLNIQHVFVKHNCH